MLNCYGSIAFQFRFLFCFGLAFQTSFFFFFFPHKFQLTFPVQFVFKKMVSPGGGHTCRLDKCAQKGLFCSCC